MHRRSTEVAVKPSVLRWARETIGLGIEDVAKDLRVSENSVSDWETGRKHPPLHKLEALAEIYRRPLAVLLLPGPPQESPLPRDFRTLPSDKAEGLSQETRLAIRRAKRLQAAAADLAERLHRRFPSQRERLRLSDDPEAAGARVRQQFGVGLSEQMNWKNEYEALSQWRRAVERKGVLVFQITLPVEQMRAFSLTDREPPAIALNTQDAARARVFSLFHEYAHVLLHEGGICDMQEAPTSRTGNAVETFCNHFSGAFLVPGGSLLSQLPTQKAAPNWSDDILRHLAWRFKVSREVILRRMVILGLAPRSSCEAKRDEWQAALTQRKRPKGGYRASPPKKCLRETGLPVCSLVLESHEAGELSLCDVADYLRLDVKYIPKIEELIGGKT